ncbi:MULTISPECIES: peptide deformylase [Bacillaceae]|uniref:Peptide deformylase n=1 Tax=Lysinibacillus composti TaxID=720633 RepID=A0A3N9UEU7_9BACI|nr:MULTISPECIES: peptide deformylase [Bacillaceae]KXI82957.1 peptide deformylase [Bacillus cereus]PGZ44514.1 peptide deformylase [Bacillus anthracis]MBM7608782.1 peptide deformylase [Lysinibacillus composti]MCU4862681.1 peptide deformylase [Bacillus cereus]MCU5031844.1 peptide deformylase [Bacillus cereus]
MSKYHSNYMITMKDIVKEGAEVLQIKTLEVNTPVSEEDKEALLCMLQYLKNSQNPTISRKYKLRPGSGLSANQIGLDKCMFAALFKDDKNEDHEYMLINPKIISHSVNMVYLPEGEGCLSVDREVKGYVPRYERIKVKAYDITGKEVVYKFKGYGSIVIQHEIDHLNGVMFYDRMNKENPFKLPDHVPVESLY